MSVHETTERNRNSCMRSFLNTKYHNDSFSFVLYLESNLGKQMGIHVSDTLNDSVELIKLKMRWRSAGWMKYLFMRVSVTS